MSEINHATHFLSLPYPSPLWGGWIAERSEGEPGGVMHEDPTLLLAIARSFPPHKGEG
jgi:hypothetical protein